MANASPTSEAILHSARALIIAGGYNGFSYADISKVVGIRNASIHHYFPSKSDLVRTLVAQYRNEVEAGIASLERNIPDPAEQLRAYIGYWDRCISDASAPICVCALLASQIPVLPDDVAAEVRAHFRTLSAWLTSILDRGASLGKFRLTGTPKAEAELIMAGVHGAMLSARAYGDPVIFRTITTPILERLISRP
ncbi:MAG: TetR/AcrR family transcriptional regulator [Bradyrhizobiaceae bacterium]|nr:MAG: TetR/AcrR family transcriptional regulator [Bradyrhizobiaceae bacterium]